MKLTKKQTKFIKTIKYYDFNYKLVCKSLRLKKSGYYKMLSRLKTMGFLNPKRHDLSSGHFGGVTGGHFEKAKNKKVLRLHSVRLRVKIVKKSDKFLRVRAECNRISFMGVTVVLEEEFLLLYLNRDFTGSVPLEVAGDMWAYVDRLLVGLENNLDLILLKDKKDNVKLVGQHWSECDNELAKKHNEEGDALQIRGVDDNKLWLKTDNSFNLDELECVHSERAGKDIERVVDFMNDIREGTGVLLSDVLGILKEVVVQNKETASGLNSVVMILKSQLGSVPVAPSDIGVRVDYIG